MIQFTIENETLPSWNHMYAGMHWTERKKIAEYWHDLVGFTAMAQKQHKATRRVEITITCYFDSFNHIIDCDNLMAKLAIDGLKGVVIPDDDPRFVYSVKTISKVDKGCKRTVIDLGYI